MKEQITITGSETQSKLMDSLGIPKGVQLEVNGWEAEDLSMIEPGTYEVFDQEIEDKEPDYEIWFCTENDDAEWMYFYKVTD